MIHASPWDPVHLPETSVFDFGELSFPKSCRIPPLIRLLSAVWSNPNKIPDSAIAIVDGPTGRGITYVPPAELSEGFTANHDHASRGDLRTQSQQVAYGLRNTMKLAPGSVVCIFSPNSFYYRASWKLGQGGTQLTKDADLLVMALQCGGYVVSGANAAYTTTEMAHQLGDSEAAVVSLLRVASSGPQLTRTGRSSVTQLLSTSLSQLRRHSDGQIKGSASPSCWPCAGTKLDLRAIVRLLLLPPSLTSLISPFAAVYKAFDDLITGPLLTPHPIADPKNTVAYLGYSYVRDRWTRTNLTNASASSSGTSGKAKGVRTSHYNMTVSCRLAEGVSF